MRRALSLFDKVCVAVGVNSDKHYLFTAEERVARIRNLFANEPRVEALSYSGMTVDLCRQLDIHFILRGIRNAQDLEYEQTVAAVNRSLAPDIETVLLLADTQYRDISSTLAREQLLHADGSQHQHNLS